MPENGQQELIDELQSVLTNLSGYKQQELHLLHNFRDNFSISSFKDVEDWLGFIAVSHYAGMMDIFDYLSNLVTIMLAMVELTDIDLQAFWDKMMEAAAQNYPIKES